MEWYGGHMDQHSNYVKHKYSDKGSMDEYGDPKWIYGPTWFTHYTHAHILYVYILYMHKHSAHTTQTRM